MDTAADRAIDERIEKRAEQAEAVSREAEQEHSRELRRAAEIRMEWIAHHRRLAVLFGLLAEHHREAVGKLTKEGAR